MVHVLQQANSPRAKKIAAMIQKGNPFTEVIGEIEKMLKLIVKEGEQDKENLDWCNTEREENDASLTEKILQIKEDPSEPESWGNYEGQSSKGGDAIQMLEFILEETKKEETEAHSDEETAQHNYEDSMADLKGEEAELEETLATLHETLAAKEEELFQKKEEHKATTTEKESIEAYLLKIKPGCDFITENF